jgi:hypothetical protein
VRGFRLEEVIDMPANNFSLVFRRGRGAGAALAADSARALDPRAEVYR